MNKKVIGVFLMGFACLLSTISFAHSKREVAYQTRINPNQVDVQPHSRLLPNTGFRAAAQVRADFANDTWVFRGTTPLGRSTGNLITGNVSDFSVGNARVAINSELNSWADLQANFDYAQQDDNRVRVEELYGTLSHFDRYPYFLRAGKQVLPFGIADRSIQKLFDSSTEQLSTTTAPSVMAGVIGVRGFDGAVYAFTGVTDPANALETKMNTYGAYLRYRNYFLTGSGKFVWDLRLGWINNIGDTDIMSVAAPRLQAHVDGMSASLMMKYRPFKFAVDYVSATESFAEPTIGSEFSESANGVTTGGAKPSAIAMRVCFPLREVGIRYPGHMMFGYEKSSQAVDVRIADEVVAKQRLYADYHYNLLKNVDLKVNFRRDWNYEDSDGANGDGANVLSTGLTFIF